jgi:transcriptional regulator with XRE-family HTH domain
MNERLKELRKKLGLTQQEFAEKLGIKRNAVTNYEVGRNAPADMVVSLICREFGVNEEWLRTGEGPQFIEITRAEQIQQMVDDIMRDHPEAFRRRFVTALAGLDDHGWIALEKFIDSITDQEEEDTRKKLHDDLDRQLSEEEAHADESGASQAM